MKQVIEIFRTLEQLSVTVDFLLLSKKNWHNKKI